MATIAPPSFAAKALPYIAAGAVVFPTGGPDGKRPLVRRFHRLRRPPGPEAISKWGRQHPDANVAVATGALSKVTVVDIDDAGKLDSVMARCGDTPALAETPRGGYHLYFRHAGERSINGLIGGVDVRGMGGLIVAPPSVRPDTGRAYRWLKGGPETLRDLPPVRPGSLPLAGPQTHRANARAHRGTIPQGQRNNTLWRRALRLAPEAESADHLRMMIDLEAEACDAPLSDAELDKIAASAWCYQVEGRNWIGGEARAQMTRTMFDRLADEPAALVLFQFLTMEHGSRTEPWAFDTRKVWQAGRLPTWGFHRIQRALKALRDRGLVICVHQGRGKGDPNLYVLASRKP